MSLKGLIYALILIKCSYTWDSMARGTGMLHPQDSESRETKLLDGMWDFRADKSRSRNQGFEEKWYQLSLSMTGEVIPMPVPSSFNDIYTDKSLRDFTGWIWYEKTFFVPTTWQHHRIVLRFDSGRYNTVAWLDGVEVLTHSGGHLPFEADVHLTPGNEVRLTVAVNNTMTPHTLPPGSIQYKSPPKYPPGYFVQNLVGFFNYAGLHRHVWLYSTPVNRIDDVTIVTSFSGTTGIVQYTVAVLGPDGGEVTLHVLDQKKNIVASGNGTKGTIEIPDVNLWWPWTMSGSDFAYLYTLQITLKGVTRDVYQQKFGVRTVRVDGLQLLINEKPFYCQGAGKHEDSDIRGKGLDLALIARDFALLRWLGANCFRTSHYPYAEEIMDMADRLGIAVIDESPAVGVRLPENFSSESLAHHLEVETEHVRRDKNRPSVIIWSVANEPDSNIELAVHYFTAVLNHVRQLDPTRPVTYVIGGAKYNTDKIAQLVDVMCINYYQSWYQDTGHTEVVSYQLPYQLGQWFDTFNKPIIMTEYGAETVTGLHTLPSFVFTEDYQKDFMSAFHSVFDELRPKYLIGEMVWNFADFMDIPSTQRVGGRNRKGIFTRQREPKAAAWLLRDRYHRILNESLHYAV